MLTVWWETTQKPALVSRTISIGDIFTNIKRSSEQHSSENVPFCQSNYTSQHIRPHQTRITKKEKKGIILFWYP